MAESNAVRTKQDGIITITNGVLTYIISKEAGDLGVQLGQRLSLQRAAKSLAAREPLRIKHVHVSRI